MVGGGTPPTTSTAVISGFEVFGNPPGLSSLAISTATVAAGAVDVPPVSPVGKSVLAVAAPPDAAGFLGTSRPTTATAVTAAPTATGFAVATPSGDSVLTAENGAAYTDAYTDTYDDAYGTAAVSLTPENVPATSVTIGATSAATFSADHAHTGTLSYEFAASASTDQCFMRLPLDVVTSKLAYIDGYVWLDAVPSVDIRIANLRSSIGPACTLVATSAGKLRVLDGLNSTLATSTASIPLSQWVRVTLEITVGLTTSTGIATATFRPAGVDAPTETLTSTTANLGTALLASSEVGKINAVATAAPFVVYVDDWKVGTGPVQPVGASSRVAFPPTGIHADGTTDDYAAISNAINAALAGGGGIVQLGAGVHLVSRWIQMKAGVTLAGAGKGTTTIKAGPTFLSTGGNHGGHPGISTDNADNVTIRDLTLDMSGDTLNGNITGRTSEYCVDIRSSTNVLVSGVAVRNPYTYSIAGAGADHFRITGCDVLITSSGRYNQLDQFHMLNSNYGWVDHNTCDGGIDGDDGLVAHTYGASTVHHMWYLNNKIRCGSNGHLFQFAVDNNAASIHDVVIAGNELWGSTRGIMAGYYSTTLATIDKVSIDGNDFHDNGYAVSIDNVGVPITNVTVTNNRTHNTGVLFVVAGTGNSVSGTIPY